MRLILVLQNVSIYIDTYFVNYIFKLYISKIYLYVSRQIFNYKLLMFLFLIATEWSKEHINSSLGVENVTDTFESTTQDNMSNNIILSKTLTTDCDKNATRK